MPEIPIGSGDDSTVDSGRVSSPVAARESHDSEEFSKPRRTPWDRLQGLDAVLRAWRKDARVWGNITLDESLSGRVSRTVALAQDLSPGVRDALLNRGIRELYTHQSEALAHARAKKHVVVATPTASGKSLCYNLPVLEALAKDPEARALYLFPTKALARDQEVALRGLLTDAGLNHGAITYDGDTPGDVRRASRERSGILLTNPDMLHAGILPHHTLWSRLFGNLRFVVIDELHTYRGVFGSHLANVLRRLFRVAAFHGSSPVVIFASATIGNPRAHAERMLGQKVELVS
jgi:DEAD/DEAH box helicase domain-containing protein